MQFTYARLTRSLILLATKEGGCYPPNIYLPIRFHPDDPPDFKALITFM